jgi:prepilin-type N-terminal cleavage/methylation domain-containing protein
MRRPGITAIELLIVLAIIAIIASIAFPKVNFAQFQVDAGARIVRISLQNAQRLAVTRQYDVVVSFDTAGRRVRVLEDNNNNASIDNGEHVTWHALDDNVHFATPPASADATPATGPIVGSNVKTIDGMPSVVFRRDGAASTDLDVYLTSKRAQNNDYRVVQVVQSTGRTEWRRYLNNKWVRASL